MSFIIIVQANYRTAVITAMSRLWKENFWLFLIVDAVYLESNEASMISTLTEVQGTCQINIINIVSQIRQRSHDWRGLRNEDHGYTQE